MSSSSRATSPRCRRHARPPPPVRPSRAPLWRPQLETMTTIGYGLPEDRHDFFDGCWSLPLIVHFQAI
eukprot:689998-Prymnesium_polylepis.1